MGSAVRGVPLRFLQAMAAFAGSCLARGTRAIGPRRRFLSELFPRPIGWSVSTSYHAGSGCSARAATNDALSLIRTLTHQGTGYPFLDRAAAMIRLLDRPLNFSVSFRTTMHQVSLGLSIFLCPIRHCIATFASNYKDVVCHAGKK